MYMILLNYVYMNFGCYQKRELFDITYQRKSVEG